MRLESLVGGKAEVVGPDATLRQAAEAMLDEKATALAVVDRRELVGIITEHDIVRAVGDDADLDEETVRDWMTEAPDTFPPDVEVEEAARWLLETGYRHLPVLGDGELLGIVGVSDLLFALVEED